MECRLYQKYFLSYIKLIIKYIKLINNDLDKHILAKTVRKHYDNRHAGRIPEDLHNCFNVLKKCQNKFDCLVNEMLLIKQLRPCLNVQSDSIRAKVFV